LTHRKRRKARRETGIRQSQVTRENSIAAQKSVNRDLVPNVTAACQLSTTHVTEPISPWSIYFAAQCG
jgi:hypothetical protein